MGKNWVCLEDVESHNNGQQKCVLHPSIVAHKLCAKKFLPKFEIKSNVIRTYSKNGKESMHEVTISCVLHLSRKKKQTPWHTNIVERRILSL
jgi:hypothetical protein